MEPTILCSTGNFEERWKLGGGGHSITKHTGGGGGGWLEGLNQKPQNIYPKIAIFKNAKVIPLNIPKVQSKGSKISNLGQNFIFTENCTPNYPYEPF